MRIRGVFCTCALFTLLVQAAASPARAAGIKSFAAVLNGGQEVPATTSEAFGVAHLTLDNTQLCYAITITRLQGGAEVGAHFHGPAAPGVNADVLLSITQTGQVKNGCVPVSALPKALKGALKKGMAYLNVHTTQFPAGEIRGQIHPAK